MFIHLIRSLIPENSNSFNQRLLVFSLNTFINKRVIETIETKKVLDPFTPFPPDHKNIRCSGKDIMETYVYAWSIASNTRLVLLRLLLSSSYLMHALTWNADLMEDSKCLNVLVCALAK